MQHGGGVGGLIKDPKPSSDHSLHFIKWKDFHKHLLQHRTFTLENLEMIWTEIVFYDTHNHLPPWQSTSFSALAVLPPFWWLASWSNCRVKRVTGAAQCHEMSSPYLWWLLLWRWWWWWWRWWCFKGCWSFSVRVVEEELECADPKLFLCSLVFCSTRL